MIKFGKFISVNFDHTALSQAKKEYKAYLISFINDKGVAESWMKPIQGLKFKPKLRAKLESFKQGDDIALEIEKVGDFYELVDITTGGPNAIQSSLPDAPKTPLTKGTEVKATGGNWETPQERADKQRYIVRQSSIANAIAFYKDDGKGFSEKNVLDTASTFEDWVFRKEVNDLVNDVI